MTWHTRDGILLRMSPLSRSLMSDYKTPNRSPGFYDPEHRSPKTNGIIVAIFCVLLGGAFWISLTAVSYTHLRAHETREDLVCRLWYATSTFVLALALFLHTFRPRAHLGHRLVITRRLRHAALFQDFRPVHQPLFLPLVSGFSSFDKGRGQVTCSGSGVRGVRRASLS